MIRARLFDGGTHSIVRSTVVPGMDQPYWTEGQWEEPFSVASNQDDTNAEMINADQITVRPYPLDFNNHMVLDLTENYATFQMDLKSYDQYSDSWDDIEAGQAVFRKDQNIQGNDPYHIQVSDTLNQEEIREFVDNPGDFIHIKSSNATDLGGTHLKNQAHLQWRHDQGTVFRPKVPDNILFTPFDFSYPERYAIFDTGGTRRYNNHLLDFAADMSFDIHLRPRLWQMQAWCMARFYWGDMFTGGYDDVVFVVQCKIRPPVAPWRHNVFSSRSYQPITDWWGVPVSYDRAIDWAFWSSECAASLTNQIWLMEWKGWSSAYLLVSVTPATLYINAEVPRHNDVVAVIQPYDSVQRYPEIYVKNNCSFNDIYPRQEVGVFYSDFFRWDMRP